MEDKKKSTLRDNVDLLMKDYEARQVEKVRKEEKRRFWVKVSLWTALFLFIVGLIAGFTACVAKLCVLPADGNELDFNKLLVGAIFLGMFIVMTIICGLVIIAQLLEDGGKK